MGFVYARRYACRSLYSIRNWLHKSPSTDGNFASTVYSLFTHIFPFVRLARILHVSIRLTMEIFLWQIVFYDFSLPPIDVSEIHCRKELLFQREKFEPHTSYIISFVPIEQYSQYIIQPAFALTPKQPKCDSNQTAIAWTIRLGRLHIFSHVTKHAEKSLWPSYLCISNPYTQPNPLYCQI